MAPPMYVLLIGQVDHEVKPEISQLLTMFMLRDIRELSECATVRLEGNEIIRMIGTKKQIENAKMLLATQLDYVTKRQQLRAHEDEMRQKLYSMEPNYGGNRGGAPAGARRARTNDDRDRNGSEAGGEGEVLWRPDDGECDGLRPVC